MFSVRQKPRKPTGIDRGIKLGNRHSLASRSRYTEKGTRERSREQDNAILIPRAAGRQASAKQKPWRTAIEIQREEPVGSNESDRTAVGSPEGKASTFGPCEWLRFNSVEMPQPQSLSTLSGCGIDNAQAIRRQRKLSGISHRSRRDIQTHFG